MAPNPMLEEACRLKLFCVLSLVAIWGGNVAAREAGAVHGMCTGTPNPALCARILSGTPANAPLNSQIAIITTYALRVSKAVYGGVIGKSKGKGKGKGKDAEEESMRKKVRVRSSEEDDGRLAEGAIVDCLDLMGNSMEQLRATIGKVSRLGLGRTGATARAQLMDARVSLSASLTFQNTCEDEVRQHPGAAGANLVLRDAHLITGSLAIALSFADTLQRNLRP